MGDIEVLRAAEVETLTAPLDLQSGASLAQLADAMPEPWRQILNEHRAALRTLIGEINAAVTENDRLLRANPPAGNEHVRASNGTGPAATDHRYPSREAGKPGATLVVDNAAGSTRQAGPARIDPNQAAIHASRLHTTYEAARQTLANLRPTSLTDFLQ